MLRLVLVLAALALLGGCAGDDDGSSAEQPPPTRPTSIDLPPEPPPPPPPPPSGPCDATTAVGLGQIYYAVTPINELTNFPSVQAYVQGRAGFLAADGRAIACARLAGSRLQTEGLRAMSTIDRAGLAANAAALGADGTQAAAVADSVAGGAVDLFTIGTELLWMAAVLPAASQGVWGPYLDSSRAPVGRGAIRQVGQLGALDPTLQQILTASYAGGQRILEQQVALLVSEAGG